jgi:hypothetical protein
LNYHGPQLQNNDFFSIQHSNDGLTFEEIDRVTGAGTSNVEQNYSFVHKHPNDGLNYYRLQQVDLDGKYEFSYVVKVENKSSIIKIYPTSIINAINIEIDDPESAKLSIMNNVGELFKVPSLTSTFNSIEISELPSGIYYAKVESKTLFHIEKIVKF